MKRSATLFTALLIASLTLATPKKDEVEMVSVKSANLFAFKVRNGMKGAQVQIYSNGVLMASQLLAKRKMVIDFSEVRYGTYIIKIKKGNTTEVFNYVKK